MPDAPVDNQSTSTDAAPAAGESNQQGQAPEAGNEQQAGQQDSGNSIDSLPDWAQAEIKSLRGENAARRRQIRETEDKFKDAKTPEQVDALITEWKTQVARLEESKLRGDIVRAAGLGAHWASRLQGSTPEELTADAKAIAADLVREPVETGDLKGGLDPNGSGDGSYDPLALAAAFNQRRF